MDFLTAVSFAIQLKVIVSCLVSAGGTFSHCLLYSAVRVNVPFASEEIRNLWNPGAPQRSDSLSNSEVMRSPQSDTRYQEYPVVGLDFSFQTYVEPASAVAVSEEEFPVMGIGMRCKGISLCPGRHPSKVYSGMCQHLE